MATANHVRNRCVTKSLPKGTPYEVWFGKHPSVSHLHVFGEKVYILNKDPTKGKFDQKGLPEIFVGYSEQSKAFRIWFPEQKKARVSRDVKFFNKFDSDGNFENFYDEADGVECTENTEDKKAATCEASIHGPNKVDGARSTPEQSLNESGDNHEAGLPDMPARSDTSETASRGFKQSTPGTLSSMGSPFLGFERNGPVERKTMKHRL